MTKTVAVVKSDQPVPAAVNALANMAQTAAAATGDIGTGDAFGQFNKLGEWIFGQEQIEVQEGSKWAINPLSLQHGFIHWPEEGRPTEHMVPATQPLPQLADLPVVDGDWNKNCSFQAQCLDGEDVGLQVIFKGSSMGFRKAWGAIAQGIATQAVSGSEVVPEVEFDSDSYTHKKYGKIMTPVIKVVGWQGLEAVEKHGTDDIEEPETVEEPDTAPPPAEAKPARRRRRRKAS